MTDLQKKVTQVIEEDINILPHDLCEKVGSPMSETLRALPPQLVCEIPTEDLYKIWEKIADWKNALFFVQSSGFVIDMNAKVPPIMMGHGDLPHIDWRNGLDAHLMLEHLGCILMINKPVFHRESMHFHFCSKKGDHMFAIYAGRDENHLLIPSIIESFKSIWAEYSSTPFVHHHIPAR